MAPGQAFEHAIGLARATPELDYGVHLTLVEEKPLLDTGSIPSLVTGNGNFHDHASTFLKQYLMGHIHMQDVYRELDAQIGKVVDQGITISHLDSHQHVHMLPRVRQVVVELAKKYAIPAIRYPYERLRWYMLNGFKNVRRIPPLMVLNTLCRMSGNSDYPGAPQFAGFVFGGNLNKVNLRTVLQQLRPQGVYEMMCHPGNADQDGIYGHWDYHWRDELAALIDPEIKNYLSQKEIELISYRTLGRGVH